MQPPQANPPADHGRLLALAWVYLNSGALLEADRYATAAMDAAPSDTAEAMLIRARVKLLQERRDEALQLLVSINLPVEPRLTATIREFKATLLTELGRYEECAHEFGFDLASSAESIDDVRVGIALACCYARMTNLSLARRQAQWVVEESNRIGWAEGVTDGLMSLALIDRTDGNWSQAEMLLLQARGIYAGLGRRRKEAQAVLNLGLQKLWRGDLKRAEVTLREAVTLAIEVGNPSTQASARMDRALTLIRLARLEEARRELVTALRLCRRFVYPRRLAIALEYTGELHLASSDYKRASHALRRALAIANRIAPDGDIVPEVRRRQAEVAYGLGRHDEALGIAKDAETRAARLGDRYERATAIRVQAQVLRTLGREEEAANLLRDGLRILEELGETFERDRFLHLLGEMLPAEETEAAPDVEPTEGAIADALGTSPTPRKGFPSNREIRAVLDEFGFIGKSRAIMDLMRQAIQVARLDLPVLIQGETGTGKELLAHVIHKCGRPAKAPLIAFNCATCPPDLLDAELFGHTRGAYTGAHSNRLGLVRSAEGGTLFLDEIGEMREESQARLLRLLDSGEVRPLGTDQSLRVKVRIIAATHADLEERIREGRFRRDLYFRLAGVRLILPPLRERPGDLRDLVKAFVEEARRSVCPGFAGFSERVLRVMERYGWPGNIRQLKHEILRAAALAPEGVPVDSWMPAEGGEAALGMLDPAEAIAILEDPKRLRRLLNENGGQMVEVARVLGVSRGHLYRVLKRLGISVRDVRTTPPGASDR